MKLVLLLKAAIIRQACGFFALVFFGQYFSSTVVFICAVRRYQIDHYVRCAYRVRIFIQARANCRFNDYNEQILSQWVIIFARFNSIETIEIYRLWKKLTVFVRIIRNAFLQQNVNTLYIIQNVAIPREQIEI